VDERLRPYQYYDTAVSICSTCYRRVDAKIVFQDGGVWMTKRCPEHGYERVLLADDIDYYRRAREVYLKPSAVPVRFNTPMHWGCPYDCGLCPDHEQHSCVTVLEVTDACNLRCPVCYASSGPDRKSYRDMPTIERMLDTIVANEGEADVVQISGGEPTLHPEFFPILDAARARPIKHVMVNTNGLTIARDEAFARRLATYRTGFEVYLQFDSLRGEVYTRLRGRDLLAEKRLALERLNDLDISTTLVMTVEKGLNDGEVGALVDFALAKRCVRGVTLQPVQRAGRTEGYDPATGRLTLTEVRRAIVNQTKVFSADDVIPVPCHPDALAMAYALKLDGKSIPLTSLIGPDVLLGGARNSIVFEKDPAVKQRLFSLFSAGHSPESGAASLKELLCCLPRVLAPGGLGYRDLFRILIVQFMDATAFDLRSVKKTCVHIVQPDGRMIPFDTFNLFYRDDLAATRLEPLRRHAEAAGNVR